MFILLEMFSIKFIGKSSAKIYPSTESKNKEVALYLKKYEFVKRQKEIK